MGIVMANNANLYGPPVSKDDTGRTSASERKKDTENQPTVNPIAKRYYREIESYHRSTSSWYEEGENIVKVYMDESITGSSRRFALLWANTETLKPAVYVKPPVAICSRRYKDKDPIARIAAEIIERATNTTFELYNADEVFRMVRDDRLLPGRGAAWVRYEARISQTENTISVYDPEIDAEVEQTEISEHVESEKVCIDYVFWQDFGHNVSRTWSDVWLVWRCVYKTQEEVAERFGSDVAARLTYGSKSPVGYNDGNDRMGEEGERYCKIYEFWDKTRNLTSWMADGQQDFLESGTPPINFSGFFPCPEPCYATKSSKSLVPKPDYCYYRDQAKEINDLTDKIGRLTEWLIVKGFIPSGPSSIADPLEEALRDKGNKELFVQVDSMTQWTEAGGAGKLIDWLPIQNVVAALQSCIQARAQLIQDVFQITGIADVLRAQSDPNETATAVELKSQTGTRRLRNTKDEIARFCRDIARLTAEVIADQFSPQSLSEMSGFKYQPPMPVMPQLMLPMGAPGMNMANVSMFPGAAMPQPMPPQQQQMMMPGRSANDTDVGMTFDDQVVALLRDDKLRSFRIDIETDSTVQADENAEKQSRTEFMNAAGEFLERAVNTVQSAPALAQTAGELLMFGMRSYRPGRNMEDIIEHGFQMFVQQAEAAQRQGPPPDPVIEVAKVQVQGEIEKNRVDAQLEAKKLQQGAQLEIRKQDLDANVKIRQQNIDAAAKSAETASRMMGRISRPGMR